MTKFKKKVLKKKVVVHCDSEEKANLLLNWASIKKGLKWSDGDSFIEDNKWMEDKEKTCYYLCFGEYCDKPFYERNDYEVIEYEDAIKQE